MRIFSQQTPTFAQQIDDAKQVIHSSVMTDALNSDGHVTTSSFKAMFKALRNISTKGYQFDAFDTKTIHNVESINRMLHDQRIPHMLHKPLLSMPKFEKVQCLQVLFQEKLGARSPSGAAGVRSLMNPTDQMDRTELNKLREKVGVLRDPSQWIDGEIQAAERREVKRVY
ncbi:hypothetical protein [Pandoraea sp. NPDC090278]|uniref:hypothetical protein n=1 Tax=Pandoraea sp. NPDC090278 TaxID=3364391 RepID=UPI00383A26E8